MTEPGDLARDTALVPQGEGRYSLDLPPRWDYLAPCGGVLMTAALRAIAAEIGAPAQRPVSATAIFCTSVPAGPLAIEVTILRRGSAATQARAALSAAGGPTPGLEVVATWARERPGPDLGLQRMPAVPRPEELPVADRSDWLPFPRNFDIRRALGRRGAEWSPGLDRSASWYRYLAPQTLPDGRLDPLCLPPLIDTMPAALYQMGGPAMAGLVTPSLDLTVHWVEDTARAWLLTHAHCRRARAGYATADLEIWDEDGRLVAYGTQTMILRRRPG